MKISAGMKNKQVPFPDTAVPPTSGGRESDRDSEGDGQIIQASSHSK